MVGSDMGLCLRVCSNSPRGPKSSLRRIPVDKLAREVDNSDLMLRGSAHGVPTVVACLRWQSAALRVFALVMAVFETFALISGQIGGYCCQSHLIAWRAWCAHSGLGSLQLHSHSAIYGYVHKGLATRKATIAWRRRACSCVLVMSFRPQITQIQHHPDREFCNRNKRNIIKIHIKFYANKHSISALYYDYNGIHESIRAQNRKRQKRYVTVKKFDGTELTSRCGRLGRVSLKSHWRVAMPNLNEVNLETGELKGFQ